MFVDEFRDNIKWLMLIIYNDHIGNPFWPCSIHFIAFPITTNSWMFRINLKRNKVVFNLIWKMFWNMMLNERKIHNSVLYQMKYNLGKWQAINSTTIHINSFAILSSTLRRDLLRRMLWLDAVDILTFDLEESFLLNTV